MILSYNHILANVKRRYTYNIQPLFHSMSEIHSQYTCNSKKWNKTLEVFNDKFFTILHI